MSLDSPPTPPRREPAGAPAGARELRIAGRLVQPQLNRIAGPEPQSSIQVEPKVMEVLLCLAEAPGEVVSREALLDRVWQGAFVSEDVLTRSIGQLRPANAYHPAISPDGARVAFSWNGGAGSDLFFTRPDRPGIWRRPLASPGQPALLAAPGLAPGDWGSWTLAGDGIYYLDRSREDAPIVQFLALGQPRPRPVASLPDLAWSGFAVSPDRRAVLYARAGRHESTVVRLENP
jgi:hypothetical protein